jgi:integrase
MYVSLWALPELIEAAVRSGNAGLAVGPMARLAESTQAGGTDFLDRYIRVGARHAQAYRPQLWLGVSNRGPMTASGIYQMIACRGRQCGTEVYPHRFRHHFSHTCLDRGGPEGGLMELNGWTSLQMLRLYGASTRSARARRTYDRIMDDTA